MKFLKKYKYLFLSFLVPIVIFAVAGYFSSTFPFGNMNMMTYDGASQHPGLLAHFLEILRGNANLFYSFNGGLGYNFYTTTAYYLLSPINLLGLFFDVEHLHYFYNISILLKIGLCGATMFTFLNYRHENARRYFLLSMCYSLMAYNVVYYSNYMWIDSVAMLPLVAMGIEKLLYEQKKLPYLFFLTLTIFFNFYIGYMVCIFSLIYFFYRYIVGNIKRKKLIKDFFVLSILSALILSVILVPVFLDLLKGKATMFENASYFVFKDSGFKSLYKLMVGSYSVSDISYGLPNVYTSLFVIILNVFYYMNDKISKKEKLASSIITVFFFLCLSFNLLDYAWQMFQAPIWYPSRYTFVISFFLTTIASDSYDKIKFLNIDKKKLISIYLTIFILVTMSMILVKNDNRTINYYFLLGSFLWLILYYISRKKEILLTILLLSELSVNTGLTLKKIPFYNSMKEQTQKVEKWANEIDKLPDDEFYRMEKDTLISHNDGNFFGYNGISYFNSMRNHRIIKFLEYYVGVSTDKVCRINYITDNPILNSLFGVKYILPSDNLRYYSNMFGQFYENSETLPLAFTVSLDIYNTELFNKEIVENYNKIMNDISSESIEGFTAQSYELINYKEFTENDKIVFKQSKTGYNKISYDGSSKESGFLYFNNLEYIEKLGGILYIEGTEYDLNSPFIYLKENEKWQLIIESDRTDNMPYQIQKRDVDVYFLKESDYLKFVDSGREKKLNIVDFSRSDHIEAEIELEEEQVVFTTIPYDDGWTIYVDGKKEKTVKIYNTFMGLKLEKGFHKITFEYSPKGFKISSTISVGGILLTVLYLKKSKLKKENSIT